MTKDDCYERVIHYMRLGFEYTEVEDIVYNDALWKTAKDLPINPDSWFEQLINAPKPTKEEMRATSIRLFEIMEKAQKRPHSGG